jgi:hypothetical protein
MEDTHPPSPASEAPAAWAALVGQAVSGTREAEARLSMTAQHHLGALLPETPPRRPASAAAAGAIAAHVAPEAPGGAETPRGKDWCPGGRRAMLLLLVAVLQQDS